jgi:hypothetical protein
MSNAGTHTDTAKRGRRGSSRWLVGEKDEAKTEMLR